MYMRNNISLKFNIKYVYIEAKLHHIINIYIRILHLNLFSKICVNENLILVCLRIKIMDIFYDPMAYIL